jgi:hypothetical protein
VTEVVLPRRSLNDTTLEDGLWKDEIANSTFDRLLNDNK